MLEWVRGGLSEKYVGRPEVTSLSYHDRDASALELSVPEEDQAQRCSMLQVSSGLTWHRRTVQLLGSGLRWSRGDVGDALARFLRV